MGARAPPDPQRNRFQYIRTEPRIGGVFPWFWNSGHYSHHQIGINVSYGIGLEDMPRCRAAYDGWGREVRGRTPGGRIRQHVPLAPGKTAGCGRQQPWRIDPSWSWCDTHH